MSTGNFVLDRITYGGLRRGRVYRYWGRPKSAKTGSALNCAEAFTSNHCADCFDHRLLCKCKRSSFNYAKMMYVDVEGRISDNRPWIEAHGIHPKRIAMVAPKGGEQVVDMADAALRSNAGIGLMGIFEGTPRTEQSFFSVGTGPSRIVLYQKNIEAHAEDVAAEAGRSVEEIVREEVRLTVLHEFGHYFGLDEEALEDV